MSILRDRQAEWNALVPLAHQHGIRVRPHSALPESIAYIDRRLEWLKAQLGSSTTPLVSDFTFGVEMECIMPRTMTRSKLAELVTAAGVPCHDEGYNHRTGGHWKIVTDNSLGDYTFGCEIVSPALSGEGGLEQLRKVCKVLTARRCKINSRCGFHVHIGAQGRPVSFFKNLVLAYTFFQDSIDTIMPVSRRASNNSFCSPIAVNRAALTRARTVNQVAKACGQHDTAANARSHARYRKLNLQSFWQHGTVEFRHHSGTVEAPKAENWVRLCLKLAAVAAQATAFAPSTDNTLYGLLTLVGATEAETAYFFSRVQAFAQRSAA
jgi:hypothetical protein